MDYAVHLNAISFQAIEYLVFGKTRNMPNARILVSRWLDFEKFSNSWVLLEQLKRLLRRFQKPVCGLNAIFSDIICVFEEIQLGPPCLMKGNHHLVWVLSACLRLTSSRISRQSPSVISLDPDSNPSSSIRWSFAHSFFFRSSRSSC